MKETAAVTPNKVNTQSRCIACFEPIHPQAKVCPHCHSSQKPERWYMLGVVLKWLGGAAAVISLIIGVLQLNELLQSTRERAAAIDNLIRAAELQMKGDDLESTLLMTQQALDLDPASSVAQNFQARIARKSCCERRYSEPWRRLKTPLNIIRFTF